MKFLVLLLFISHTLAVYLLAQDTEAADQKVIEAVANVARRHGVPRARIAIAWLLSNPAVAAPIVGVSRESQIIDAVEAVSVKLSQEDIAEMTEHYIPHKIMGFE